MGDRHPAFAGKLSIKTRSEEPAEVFDNGASPGTRPSRGPSRISADRRVVSPSFASPFHPHGRDMHSQPALAHRRLRGTPRHGAETSPPSELGGLAGGCRGEAPRPARPRHRAAPSGAHATFPPDVPHLVPGPPPSHLIPPFPTAFHPSHAPLHHPPPFFHHAHYPPPQYVALPTGRLAPSPHPPPGSPPGAATAASRDPATGSGMGTGFYPPTVPADATRGFDRGGAQRRSSRGGRGARANRAARRSAEAAIGAAGTGIGNPGEPGDGTRGTGTRGTGTRPSRTRLQPAR